MSNPFVSIGRHAHFSLYFDLECILTKVEAHLVKSQEWQTYYTVIPVNIGDIKICVAGDMSQAHWHMRAMGDG